MLQRLICCFAPLFYSYTEQQMVGFFADAMKYCFSIFNSLNFNCLIKFFDLPLFLTIKSTEEFDFVSENKASNK